MWLSYLFAWASSSYILARSLEGTPKEKERRGGCNWKVETAFGLVLPLTRVQPARCGPKIEMSAAHTFPDSFLPRFSGTKSRNTIWECLIFIFHTLCSEQIRDFYDLQSHRALSFDCPQWVPFSSGPKEKGGVVETVTFEYIPNSLHLLTQRDIFHWLFATSTEKNAWPQKSHDLIPR